MTIAGRASSRTHAPAAGDSLGSGAAGIALLHIERARTATGTWATAHQWVSAATRDAVTAQPNVASLYRGAPAVAYILATAAHPGYAAALDTLDGHIADLIRHRLSLAHERIDGGQPGSVREYDLISGLTGIGAYLLHRGRHRDLLRDVLAYLVRLTEPLQLDGETLPGWWSGEQPRDQPAHRWPGGHGNLGLAHGVAGPLALLSIAMRRGVTVDGHREAIARICSWLDRWRTGSGRQVWWPGRITRSEKQAGAVQQRGPQRPSWCYGTPGVARAQQLAALAMDDRRRQRQAEDALVGCANDEHQLAQLHDATLCHGWAGLIQTIRRAAADARDDGPLTAALPHLHFRFEQELEHHGLPDGDGLLEGGAGIRLVQHRASIGRPSATRWDACLLLSG